MRAVLRLPGDARSLYILVKSEVGQTIGFCRLTPAPG